MLGLPERSEARLRALYRLHRARGRAPHPKRMTCRSSQAIAGCGLRPTILHEPAEGYPGREESREGGRTLLLVSSVEDALPGERHSGNPM